LVTQVLQLADPIVQLGAPGGGQTIPVSRRGSASFRQAFQGLTDGRERDAQPLGNLDDRDPAQSLTWEAPLVTGVPRAFDQALGFVKPHGGYGDAAALGNLSDRQGSADLTGMKDAHVWPFALLTSS